jgi:orotate phosphoribosyltransferase
MNREEAAKLGVDSFWLGELKGTGALWIHDGNPRRPYARLTSGKISNIFFNASKLIENPWALSRFVDEIFDRLEAAQSIYNLQPDVVVGPAAGAITLAYELAERYDALGWFTEDVGKGDEKIIKLKRFEPEKPGLKILGVEDVITTGGSVDDTVRAVTEADPSIVFYDIVICIVNRSGKMVTPGGKNIVALINLDQEAMAELGGKTWDEGQNPFIPDGKELVPPLRPKERHNWRELNAEYPA